MCGLIIGFKLNFGFIIFLGLYMIDNVKLLIWNYIFISFKFCVVMILWYVVF